MSWDTTECLKLFAKVIKDQSVAVVVIGEYSAPRALYDRMILSWDSDRFVKF